MKIRIVYRDDIIREYQGRPAQKQDPGFYTFTKEDSYNGDSTMRIPAERIMSIEEFHR